jgi:hypothetical protein
LLPNLVNRPLPRPVSHSKQQQAVVGQQQAARRDKLLQPFPVFIKVDPLHLVDAVRDISNTFAFLFMFFSYLLIHDHHYHYQSSTLIT